jgi:hypothetical protein
MALLDRQSVDVGLLREAEKLQGCCAKQKSCRVVVYSEVKNATVNASPDSLMLQLSAAYRVYFLKLCIQPAHCVWRETRKMKLRRVPAPY